MKTGIIQRIFEDHYETVDATRPLDWRSRKAAWNILTCRTPAQGYHIDECPNKDYQIRINNSCKHRACPMCGATGTELWIERQNAKELRCPHHQVVFTSPDLLRNLWRWNRKLFTNLYFHAAWHSLQILLGDKKWLGAQPGVIAVFQSWGDELPVHLHIHFIVTSGGLTPKGKWVEADPKHLLPVDVLKALFRRKLLEYLLEAFSPKTPGGIQKEKSDILVPPPDSTQEECLELFSQLNKMDWHVQIEPAYEEARGAIIYTGRYIRRGPLSEKRIVAYDGETATIAYVHPDKHESNVFNLPAVELINRLLAHAPEKGTHCARTYGLYHSACRDKLNQARSQLGQPPYDPETELPDTHELLHRMFKDFTADLCPKCRARLQTVLVYRPGQSPPWRKAA